VEALKRQKAAVEKTTARLGWVGGLPRTPDGEVDYKEDFFAQKAFLTVSGQMEAEVYACALTRCGCGRAHVGVRTGRARQLPSVPQPLHGLLLTVMLV